MQEYDYSQRADALADRQRALLITLNSGAIGVVFAVAGHLASQGIGPGWAATAVRMFVLGLVTTAASMALAKYKAVKRRDAREKDSREAEGEISAGQGLGVSPNKEYIRYLTPNLDALNAKYTALRWRNTTWEGLALMWFVVGCWLGLSSLGDITTA